MLVKETKFIVVFIVTDLVNAKHLAVHAQRLIHYTITKTWLRVSGKLKQQAIDFDIAYRLVDGFHGTRKQKGKFQVLIRSSGLYEDNDVTW